MKRIAFLAGLVLCAATVAVTPAPANAGELTGTVTHVSTNNIKVKDSGGTEVSFLLAPSFDQVFSSDGKTTFQMQKLPGRHVKVVYHQALGVRYADKIIVLN